MRNSKVIAMLREELRAKDERIVELEDRLQSKSLAELRAFRPVAMQSPEPELDGVWLSDPTGMVTEFVPRDAAEG